MTKEAAAIAIYETEDGNHIQVSISETGGWLTQDQISDLFGTTQSNVSQHLKKIFDENELERESNIRKSNIAAGNGKKVSEYSIDAVISVGYRISSVKATRFRQWATTHLRSIAIDGYSIDTSQPDALKKLAAKVRELRNSEVELYRRVRDVFKETASDYQAGSQTAKTFFATVQDKFLYAITGKTAAQLILERCDATKPQMGMQTFRGETITIRDAKIGKNYLTEDELYVLNILGEQFMLFTESNAFRGKKMTMEEIATKLNMLLMTNEYPVLYEYGDTFDRGPANTKVERELTAYRGALAAKSR